MHLSVFVGRTRARTHTHTHTHTHFSTCHFIIGVVELCVDWCVSYICVRNCCFKQAEIVNYETKLKILSCTLKFAL